MHEALRWGAFSKPWKLTIPELLLALPHLPCRPLLFCHPHISQFLDGVPVFWSTRVILIYFSVFVSGSQSLPVSSFT